MAPQKQDVVVPAICLMLSLSRAWRCFPVFFGAREGHSRFKAVFDAIRQLMAPKEAPKKRDRFPIKRKAGCLSGKGMNESFKYEEENIIKDKDLSPGSIKTAVTFYLMNKK